MEIQITKAGEFILPGDQERFNSAHGRAAFKRWKKKRTLPCRFPGLVLLLAACVSVSIPGQTPPAPAAQPTPTAQPAPTAQSAPAAQPALATQSAPAAQPAPPPSAPAKRSQDDLEKLVAPIALYPDPLIATLLPASAYPLEIVQAARFVKDTNNIAKLDAQPWDDNVKAVARFADVIAQMDENIGWTSDLGDAFINQPKELMDAIQSMRLKAKGSGALKTTEQQNVTVTNTVVTNTVEQNIVYVTNEVVQIQPAQPEVIYVPQYNPTVVYAGYPVTYPGYYYPPYPPYGSVAAASIVSFGAGMAVGAIIANNCDWGGGGCYHGNFHSDVNVNRNVNVNNNFNRTGNANINRTANGNANVNRGQKWQPDQSRLKNSGSASSSAQSREARGWGSGSTAQNRTGAAGEQARNSTGANRAAPTANTRPSSTAGANRPATTGANRPSTTGANRPSSTAGATRPSSTANTSRPASSGTSASRNSGAFSGVNSGASERSASQRGAASRSSGSYGGTGGGGGSSRGSGSGGGGARGGGGGRGGGGRR